MSEQSDSHYKFDLPLGGILFTLAAAIICAGIFYTILKNPPTDKPTLAEQAAIKADEDAPKPEELSSAAFVISKGYVKQSLKSPATADFPLLDSQTRHLGEGRYAASSYVDAQNSFGAKLRTYWSTELRYKGAGLPADPASWELISLVIDGQTIYTKPIVP